MTHEATTRDIARLPTRILGPCEEFSLLLDQRRLISKRVNELLMPQVERALGIGHVAQVCTLPKSGLRIVDSKPGSLFCRGGRLNG